MHARDLAAVCRVSVHYYNTEQEVRHFVGLVRAYIRKRLVLDPACE